MKEYRITINNPASFDIEEVIAEFAANGFTVTREAIEHNYDAWSCDYKSGYRDEANGCFLFSPCGCNPLRFDACEIIEGLDWQFTYKA